MKLDPKEIGAKIRSMRRTAKLSQEALAARAEIDRTTLAKIETGARLPDLTTLIALAGALGVSVVAITGEVESGRVRTRDLIERFKASPWAETLVPPASLDELAEIEELGDLIWTRLPPTEQAIHLLVLILRTGGEL